MTTACRVRTASAEDTRELGAALSTVLRPGDLILLVGDLGAGKTVLVQGIGRGLEVVQPVTSPTYALHHRYDGQQPIDHLDAYRLEDLVEARDLDLPELLEGGGIVVIEWGDVVRAAVPPDHLEVLFATSGEQGRELTVVPHGEAWVARASQLGAAVEPWSVPGSPDGDAEVAAC